MKRKTTRATRFRLAQGRFPHGADELVPQYLDEWPRDPFDGQPMRYSLSEEGVVVYSIGTDMTDDGGRVVPPEGELRPRDYGVRLFPPRRRGLTLVDKSEPETELEPEAERKPE